MHVNLLKITAVRGISRNLPGRFAKSIDADDAGRGAYHPATWNITTVAVGGKVRRENLAVFTFAPEWCQIIQPKITRT